MSKSVIGQKAAQRLRDICCMDVVVVRVVGIVCPLYVLHAFGIMLVLLKPLSHEGLSKVLARATTSST